MIYTLNDNILISEKMTDWGEIFVKELTPLFPELGLKLAASFHACTGNMNEGYHFWIYEDLTSYMKAREIQGTNTDWQRVNHKLNALRITQTQTILEPNPWSPMK